jgi:DNA-binding FadR family transcriptional regulator
MVIRWRLAGDGSDEQLRSLSELRAGFEPVAAALAARRATPAHCGALTGAVMDMAVHARSGDLEAYLAADVTFHRTLLQASGNEMFGALDTVVAEVLSGRTHHGLMPATPEAAAVRLHADVAEAVQAGDAVGDRRAMQAIIEEAAEAMLGPTDADPDPVH